MNTAHGTLCIKVDLDPAGARIEICHADPVVWASEQFLEELRAEGGRVSRYDVSSHPGG